MITQIIKKTTLPLFLLISPSMALQGTFITEPFSCEVALADYAELSRSVKEDNPQFKQEMLEISLKAVTKELAEHAECEVK